MHLKKRFVSSFFQLKQKKKNLFKISRLKIKILDSETHETFATTYGKIKTYAHIVNPLCPIVIHCADNKSYVIRLKIQRNRIARLHAKRNYYYKIDLIDDTFEQLFIIISQVILISD